MPDIDNPGRRRVSTPTALTDAQMETRGGLAGRRSAIANVPGIVGPPREIAIRRGAALPQRAEGAENRGRPYARSRSRQNRGESGPPEQGRSTDGPNPSE